MLAQSIERTGLLHAIRVAADTESGKYTIISGSHRFAAHECLGLHRINAIIVEGDPIESELDLIEENLARRHLTILERALMERRRKQLYLVRNPDTRRGTAGGLALHSEQPTALSFAGSAARTGSGQRSVERRVQIAEALAGEVAMMLVTSSISNNQTQLLALARQPSTMRKAIATLIAEGKTKAVKQAIRLLSGFPKVASPPHNKTVRARLEKISDGHAGSAQLRGRLIKVTVSNDLTHIELTDAGEAPDERSSVGVHDDELITRDALASTFRETIAELPMALRNDISFHRTSKRTQLTEVSIRVRQRLPGDDAEEIWRFELRLLEGATVPHQITDEPAGADGERRAVIEGQPTRGVLRASLLRFIADRILRRTPAIAQPLVGIGEVVSSVESPTASQMQPPMYRLMDELVNLGFPGIQARAAAHRLSGRYASESFEALLKETLAFLAPR